MTGAVIPFDYQGHNVRVVDIDYSPWWVAKDVCGVLNMGNPRSSLALLDDDEKGVHSMDTPGGPQRLQIVNEPGLYSLILRSRKPEAKEFKRWITHEVLPAIRKTGAYQVAPGSVLTEREMALVNAAVSATVKSVLPQLIEAKPAPPKIKYMYEHPLTVKEGLDRIDREDFPMSVRKLARTLRANPASVSRYANDVGVPKKQQGVRVRDITSVKARLIWASICKSDGLIGRNTNDK